MKRSFLILFLSFFVLVGSGTQAFAQGQSSSVLVLLTEQTADKSGQDTQVFWWADLSARRVSQTDEFMEKSLQKYGSSWAQAPQNVNVSRIYRVALLSDANAFAFSSVLGIQRPIFVGKVVYERLESDGFLPPAWHVRVDARLLEANWRPGNESFPVFLERVFYDEAGRDVGANLMRLKEEVGDSLGALASGWAKQNQSPVGVYDGLEPLIVLRGVENGKFLDEVLAQIRAIHRVSDVAIRWSARGQIALEINPGTVDPKEVVEYVVSTLVEQEASRWRLAAGVLERPTDALILDFVRSEAE